MRNRAHPSGPPAQCTTARGGPSATRLGEPGSQLILIRDLDLHAFEVTNLQFTLKQALDMIGHFGTAYIIGMQKPGATVDVTIDPMNPLACHPAKQGYAG